MASAHFDNAETAARKIINDVGKTITIGVPLGIGKPIGLLNALYRLAVADPTIQLTILTALTLSRPILDNELEKRFVEPILDRVLKDYEDPLYETARVLQQLPSNINVIEFFLTEGKYLSNSYVQQNYISTNYTNAVRDLSCYSVNVLAQQVAHSKENPNQYSLSCNTDLFHAVVDKLNATAAKGNKIAIVAEVNLNLPFMHGNAIVEADIFTDIVDTKKYHALFAIPRDEISPQDHLIGLYTSCLIQDDSCLQIGIGKLSNSLANALILRHQYNAVYQETIKQLSVSSSLLSTFDKGLYASTEMLSDEYLQLYKAGILKKRVYDHSGLQRLLNEGQLADSIMSDTLDVLLKNKIISKALTDADKEFLQYFGIVSQDLTPCVGKKLLHGKIIHAGFFIGSVDFYQQLHDLSFDELQTIEMTSIARTNKLSWSPELLTLQRKNMRFVNSSMMVTLGGVVVSDGLKNLQEFSGVGGQVDFVNMSQALEDSRSIINCRSTRKTKNGVESNIVWDYPNQTLPRYLRDIIVTEYGIADCRSKTDSEVIKAMLNVTDSRFQQTLLATAKKYGKLAQDYEIPEAFQQNYPEKVTSLVHALQEKGHCKPYPFGSELTDEEQVLARALLSLKKSTAIKLITVLVKSLFRVNRKNQYDAYLSRMKLLHPKSFKDFLYKKMLVQLL